MVSKNQIKLITSLQHKKFRTEHQLFIAEGVKVIQELLASNFVLEHLFETEAIFEQVSISQKTVIKEADMKRITALSSASSCLAIFKIPSPTKIDTKGLIVALDDIRDPGNLGTIIRLCDWFGVTQLLCSYETVDVYNPKVIQATMGSISRVKINYVDLNDYVLQSSLPVFGTFMDGKNLYKETLPKEAILILGNEANGISASLEKSIKNRIAIPRFGDIQKTESLNVATAAAIFLSEFRRESES
ncbi:RNA methyltransferase [Flavobacterium sangjuense]|uniref:23S rRNA (Guanosine-2'-O-)-methyltransferase RlmB n=1 Tax=Flavobacterium sangjuense TaxID=2518177 RepID=A0A4P7PRK9_9FLAO|nr:RNA methyltransferase [Flavobacterium sangjuense]QBZ97508.1 23S rRNA (guanosine-2'-O-)-methyltransferase RlmB [Flavobacterium sangjuense]